MQRAHSQMKTDCWVCLSYILCYIIHHIHTAQMYAYMYVHVYTCMHSCSVDTIQNADSSNHRGTATGPRCSHYWWSVLTALGKPAIIRKPNLTFLSGKQKQSLNLQCGKRSCLSQHRGLVMLIGRSSLPKASIQTFISLLSLEVKN